MLCKLKGAGTSAKRMNSILRHIAKAFPPDRQGTIQNYHRVISINTKYLNGAKLRLSDRMQFNVIPRIFASMLR